MFYFWVEVALARARAMRSQSWYDFCRSKLPAKTIFVEARFRKVWLSTIQFCWNHHFRRSVFGHFMFCSVWKQQIAPSSNQSNKKSDKINSTCRWIAQNSPWSVWRASGSTIITFCMAVSQVVATNPPASPPSHLHPPSLPPSPPRPAPHTSRSERGTTGREALPVVTQLS